MSDESLFREVDEEVRQDQIKQIWKRYGTLISAAALALVLIVAGVQGWRYWQVRQSQAAAQAYADAVQLIADGKPADGEAALAAIDHGGFGVLAKIRRAAALAAEGKADEAVASYDAVANDGSIDQAFRDLAQIRAGYVLADKLSPAELISRLGAYDKDDNPWRASAREIFALSAYRTRDYTMADRYANAIAADLGAPLAQRQRAQMLLQLLAPLLPAKAATQ